MRSILFFMTRPISFAPFAQKMRFILIFLLLCPHLSVFAISDLSKNTQEAKVLFTKPPITIFTEQFYVQGDALATLLVSDYSLNDFSALLKNEAGKLVLKSKVFKILTVNDTFAYVALFGISPEFKTGKYTLTISGKINEQEVNVSVSIELRKKAFHETLIKLNQKLTNLQTRPDPEKTRESEELWEVLSSTSSEALFYSEAFQKPFQNAYVSSSFGDTRTYKYPKGKSSKSIHFGVDMPGKTGTELSAPSAGRVVLAQKRILTGNSIIIEHLPGFFTIYYHLDSLKVKKGDVVKKGTIIGTLGSTGFSTGPHLHWEARINTVPVDPYQFLKPTLLDKSSIISKIASVKKGGD